MAGQVVSRLETAVRPDHRDHGRSNCGGALAPVEMKIDQGKLESEEPAHQAKSGDVEDEVMCEPCTEERAPRTIFDPVQPTKKQICDHDVTHLPYRSWCKWCVMAKGREDKHPRVT